MQRDKKRKSAEKHDKSCKKSVRLCKCVSQCDLMMCSGLVDVVQRSESSTFSGRSTWTYVVVVVDG